MVTGAGVFKDLTLVRGGCQAGLTHEERAIPRSAPYPRFYFREEGGGNPEKVFLIYRDHLELGEKK